MEILENELEEMIYSASVCDLQRRGLHVFGHKMRQVNLGAYGRLDMLYVNRGNDFNPVSIKIIELKKDKLNATAFWQATRYAAGIKHWMRINRPDVDFEISILLIGKEIDVQGDFCFTADVFQNIRLYKYNLGFNGLFFTSVFEYHMNNHGFANRSKVIKPTING